MKCIYLVELLDQVTMLVGDVLFNERGRLEQLLTRLAAELALVLLLDVCLASTRQFPMVVISKVN